MNDLRLVFRYPSDLGKDRTKETPLPHVLRDNLRKFVESWRDAGFKLKVMLYCQRQQSRRLTNCRNMLKRVAFLESLLAEKQTEMRTFTKT